MQLFLVSQGEKSPQGSHLDTVAGCQASLTCELKAFTPAAFEDCFSKWLARWGKCIEAEGEYFEGADVLVPE